MVLRTAWELLLGLFVINLAIGIVMSLSLPGTAYVTGGLSGVNATDYESHFNSTAIAKGWSATPFSGIPVIGDIFAGFGYLVQNLGYLIDGLPTMLLYIEHTFITDSTAALSFEIIANAIRAIYALLFAVFLIEFISGRDVSS